MTENPHEKNREAEIPAAEKEIPDENGAWSEDQKRRGYYYDDACGYEIYDPEEDEKEEDEARSRSDRNPS